MREVTLEEILEAREERAFVQKKVLDQFHSTIISFTMNIPGPLKDSPLIRRAFQFGCETLKMRLKNEMISVLYEGNKVQWTGCEMIMAVNENALNVKKICTRIEDETPIGRLFDMDVLDQNGIKMERYQVNGASRNCIVCGLPGRGCASRRTHGVDELYHTTVQIMEKQFEISDRKKIASIVTKGLMEEVCTTPKPGLVDCNNNGSHKDMNTFTFISSISSLIPYWEKCVEIGQETSRKEPKDTFIMLRSAGKVAENSMFYATGGVNTNKGAIFTLGIICGAVGRLWKAHKPYCGTEKVLEECGKIARTALRLDFDKKSYESIPKTAGMELFLKYGIKGIRGEVAEGLPSVEKIGLPVFKEKLSQGFSRNDAGVISLLYLVGEGKDTNMMKRGGLEMAEHAADMVNSLIKEDRNLSMKKVEILDEWFISKNLSPGGCADLLSVIYVLYDLEKEKW